MSKFSVDPIFCFAY